jgi:hypothetical protein
VKVGVTGWRVLVGVTVGAGVEVGGECWVAVGELVGTGVVGAVVGVGVFVSMVGVTLLTGVGVRVGGTGGVIA